MKKQEKNYLKFLKNANIKHNNFYDYDKFTYETARIAGTITCPIHGDFQQRPDNHLQGKACKLCGISKLKTLFTKTKEKFIEESNLIHNNKYNYSKTDYINDSTKLIVICPIHGEFEQLANKHINGRGCPNCKGDKFTKSMNTKYSKIFIDRAKKVHGDKYNYSKVNYKKSSESIIIICQKHGEFKQIPYNHLIGKGCKLCKNSHGEVKIENYLCSKNIVFKREKTFIDCKNKEALPFDFYLEKYNLIIEFDGEQHFKPMGYFGGEKKLLYTQQNDKIKNEYCQNNNIRLIRIPYTEVDNIENILTKLI